LAGDVAVPLTSDRDADAVGLLCCKYGFDAESSSSVDGRGEDEWREESGVIGFVGSVGSGGRGGEMEKGDGSDERGESRDLGGVLERRGRACRARKS
jgi:hypothetical protein